MTVDHPLRERILQQVQAGDQFCIIAHVLNEFLFGIDTLPRAQSNLREWQRLKDDFVAYDVTTSDAKMAAELRVELRKDGWQLDVVDSFNAVIAVRNQLVLLTTDSDYRAVPSLRVENWRNS